MNSPKSEGLSEYKYLCDTISDSKSNYANLPLLDLTGKFHINLPPPRLLICFSSLRSLCLSHNHIETFSAYKLMQGAPHLEELNLSYNRINKLDDLIDLGSSKSLKRLDIVGNPVSDRYVRIRLIEFLLFPAKYQVSNPVKILTATYHLSSRNVDFERKPDIIVSKSSKPRSVSGGKKGHMPSGHQTQAVKLDQERCPVPRKTRYPMLMVFNGEIISIGDIQSLIVGKDINGLLFEDGEKIKVGLVRSDKSDKLHQKYIESYIKRKNKRKEEEAEVPSLNKLAHIMGQDNDLLLLYSKDKLSHDRKRMLKTDYEEELWKGPADARVKPTEFSIGITKFKELEKLYGIQQEEKKKRDNNIPKKVKIKLDKNGQTRMGRKIEKSNSSVESSAVDEDSNRSRQSIRFPAQNQEEEVEDLEPITQKEIQVQNVSVSPRRSVMRKKELARSKSVIFDKDEMSLLCGNESGAGETGFLKSARRTNSIFMENPKIGEGHGFVPSAFVAGSWTKEESPEKNKKKKFYVVKESVPNKGLPLFGYSHKQRKGRRSLSMQSFKKISSFGNSFGDQSAVRVETTINEKNQTSGFTDPLKSLDKSKLNAFENPRSSFEHSKTGDGPDANAFFTFQQPEMYNFKGKTTDQKGLVFLTQRKESQISDKHDSLSFTVPTSLVIPTEQPQLRETNIIPLAVPGQSITQEKVKLPQTIQEKSLLQQQKSILKKDFSMVEMPLPRPQSVGTAVNLFGKINSGLVNSQAVREFSARKKVQTVKEQEKERLKLSKVIFLRRSNSVALSSRDNQGDSRPAEKSPLHQRSEIQLRQREKRKRETSPLVQKTIGNLSTQQSFLSSQLVKNNNHSLMYMKKSKVAKEQILKTCEDRPRERISTVKAGISYREEAEIDLENSFTTRSHSMKRSQSQQSMGQIAVVSYRVNIGSPEKGKGDEKRRNAL